MTKFLLTSLLILSTGLAAANSGEELIPADQAFVFSAEKLSDGLIRAKWEIADGYYMYRDKIGFAIDGHNTVLAHPVMPEGQIRDDTLFGEVETYTEQLVLDLPVNLHDSTHFTLIANGQGCNEPVGVCYPPMERSIEFGVAETKAAEEPDSLALSEPSFFNQSGMDTASDLRSMLAQGFQDQDFLEVNEAFRVNFSAGENNNLEAFFQVEEGYYLYRGKISFDSSGGPTLSRIAIPEGENKTDEYFGEVMVLSQDFTVPIELGNFDGNLDPLVVDVSYQGCAEDGICYAPVVTSFSFSGLKSTSPSSAPVQTELALVRSDPSQAQSFGTNAFGAPSGPKSLSLTLVASALVAGLLLTFTPCVLPMIPILSGVIAGQGNQLSGMRGGLLAAIYVLGTAFTYAAMGALAGATGDQLQAYFQNVWAIGIMSALFFMMALSMFGMFEIQMPSFIQSRIQGATTNLGGSIPLVFLLGAFSALIIGACVSPVLITFLGIAVSAGSPVLGAQIMLVMALGMGIPLVLLGFGAGHLIPRAGAWMERVRHGFGIMLIAVSIYLLGALPQVPVLLLWGAFFIFVAIYSGATSGFSGNLTGWEKFSRSLAIVLLVWGVMALVGGFMGHRDIFRPIPQSVFTEQPGNESVAAHSAGLQFLQVGNVPDLEQAISNAGLQGRKVMVDYYADWCVDCVRMEETTFRDPDIVQTLDESFISIQIDVTDPVDENNKALKKYFGVFGPPATIFLDSAGQVVPGSSFYGYKDSSEFQQVITGLDAI